MWFSAGGPGARPHVAAEGVRGVYGRMHAPDTVALHGRGAPLRARGSLVADRPAGAAPGSRPRRPARRRRSWRRSARGPTGSASATGPRDGEAAARGDAAGASLDLVTYILLDFAGISVLAILRYLGS
ncbi:hypothetical protein [Embleya sp. NPDC059237]|uniref:hypothetical protein n=1 Tax=Embleya sp. NPDC059237 TaxID=3346784 RepID=UPI0036C01CE5